MAISFELTDNSRIARDFYRKMAIEQMRPIARRYDVEEHTLPSEWVDHFWQHGRKGPPVDFAAPADGMVQVCIQVEELCWGDAALYLRMPTSALGGAAVREPPAHRPHLGGRPLADDAVDRCHRC